MSLHGPQTEAQTQKDGKYRKKLKRHTRHRKKLKNICRHSSFYHASLYYTSQITRFIHTEGLWQPCVKQVDQRHFPNSVCSLLSLWYILVNSRNISNLFIIIIFVMVICDQWPLTVVALRCHKHCCLILRNCHSHSSLQQPAPWSVNSHQHRGETLHQWND